MISTLQQTFVEENDLFEVSNYENVSPVVRFLGKLCTMPILSDICQFVIGNIFGPFAPSSYYNVKYSMQPNLNRIQNDLFYSTFIGLVAGLFIN